MAGGASIKWRGNRDTKTMIVQVQQEAKTLKANATEALDLSIAEGALMTQDNLENAVTKTGLARAQGRAGVLDLNDEGGYPGRHVTGNMIASVSYELRNLRARVVTGVFGWWGANFEQYFRDQDLGEGNIPAARALPMAYVVAVANFRKRMNDVVNGRRPS